MNTHRHPHNASSSGGFLDTVRMLVKQKRIERVTAPRPALILYTIQRQSHKSTGEDEELRATGERAPRPINTLCLACDK